MALDDVDPSRSCVSIGWRRNHILIFSASTLGAVRCSQSPSRRRWVWAQTKQTSFFRSACNGRGRQTTLCFSSALHQSPAHERHDTNGTPWADTLTRQQSDPPSLSRLAQVSRAARSPNPTHDILGHDPTASQARPQRRTPTDPRSDSTRETANAQYRERPQPEPQPHHTCSSLLARVLASHSQLVSFPLRPWP